MNILRKRTKFVGIVALAIAFLLAAPMVSGDEALADPPAPESICNRILTADVVAFDMPLMWNRFGPQNINGMMFALKRDVINLDTGQPLTAGGAAIPGRVALRPDKRPRPLVLRMGAGDCLTYTVTNLLTPAVNPNPFAPVEVRSDIDFNLNIDDQVADRRVSLRFQGTQLVNGISEDMSFVGRNASSLVPQGGTSPSVTIYAEKENTYVGTSYGATIGGEGLGGNTAGGLWAVLNVGPKGSAFYRSQVTREEMDLAADASGHSPTATGQPVVDYETVYPGVPDAGGDCTPVNPGNAVGEVFCEEAKAGLPIINMVDVNNGNEIVHSDINAIVAHGGTDFVLDGDGHFPTSTYPLEDAGYRNPTVPNRLEPFREFTIAFHDEVVSKQAFPLWFEDPVLKHTLHGVRDSFMINYGSGGIGTEIIASRLRVGPPHDCVNCAYEEFFLTAFTVSDVGQLVDIPANFGLEDCAPGPTLPGCEETGPKANYALFPDDPSNVHHSYTGDFTKFRNIHAGPGEQHIFHLHNHQWLFNANDDNSNYLDAQGIGPGSGYTYEINFGGSGNRNKTAGDAIFHCHFYPHFAQGMWEMWRVHDVFEQGTAMQATLDGPGGMIHTSFVDNGLGIGNGTPAAGARALPDAEILAGTPIPGVVPLPGKAMAPMPVAGVTVKLNPNTVCLDPAAGLVAKVPDAGGNLVCPDGTDVNGDAVIDANEAIVSVVRNTGSLADVPRVADAEFGLANPGYPFWIAGMEHSVGQRPTTPPLDMITQAQAQALADGPNPLWDHPGFASPLAVHGWDGGLPRYAADGYSAGSTAIVSVLEPRLDLSKELTKVKPFFFPEEGTDLEQAAMAYHAKRNHPTFISDGVGTTAASFVLNGQPPVPGAPYNEPCVDDKGALLDATTTGEFFDGYPGGFGVSGKSPFNAETPRVYKAANIQFDAVFNKVGYHYPQERIITLWQDVVPTILKERPPEPFVLRNNTFDCTQYVHSNVVPKAFEVDDYQVRTPTDIIGQHIHLPKWDLTTADGAANGWNYEDGTLSHGMVVEIIEAINAFNADSATPVTTNIDGNPVIASDGHNLTTDGTLEPADHPFFGDTQFGEQWAGARSTMQRWFFDPVVNVQKVDRGLGIIFTHDHYGPSTHQQIGLYATVLVEPATSKWVHNETGTQLYTRTGPNPEDDGGPTSWQAAILPGEIEGYTQNVGGADVEPHREFYFELSDFQHAYQPDVYVGADGYGFPLAEYVFTDSGVVVGGPGQTANGTLLAGQGDLNPDPEAFRDAIQPSIRLQAPLVNGFPVDIWIFPPFCDAAGLVPRPCPEAISADDPGMYVVNYRNESLMARVFDPNRLCADGNQGCQATGDPGDLAFALQSRDDRAWTPLNSIDGGGLVPWGYFDGVCSNGVFCPPINQVTALDPGDPFTPMMRVFAGDPGKLKVQTGATEEEHVGSLHGLKWLQGGSGFGEAKNSGWRNSQSSGISEQFGFRSPVLPDVQQAGNRADHAYSVNSSFDGWNAGIWGIIRAYSNNRSDLFALPDNDMNHNLNIVNDDDFDGVCELGPKVRGKREILNLREYEVVAVLAEDVLPVPAGVTVQDLFPGTHEGRAPDGGTLVYNSRPDPVAPGAETGVGAGPLHDPTAILYVEKDNLVFAPGVRTEFGDPVGLQPGTAVEPLVLRANAGDCIETTLHNALLGPAITLASAGAADLPVIDEGGNPVFEDQGQPLFVDQPPIGNANGIGDIAFCPAGETLDPVNNVCCPDGLIFDGTNCTDGGIPVAPAAPLTELVAAVDVLFDEMPNLANGNALGHMVTRDAGAGAVGMTSFNNNLIRPSAIVGLHPALVEYDVTRSDGTVVGKNNPGQQIARPGEKVTYEWYAGNIEHVPAGGPKNRRNVEIVTTPIEFGGFNLMAADKLKQPQKGAVGAGVIYPEGSAWSVDPLSNTAADVGPDANEDGILQPGEFAFRDFTTVAQKGASMSYADSFPVHNILGEGTFGVAEDAQDMGHMAINYGTEPLWFRFGINPTNASGNALAAGQLGAQANAGDAHSNGLVSAACLADPTLPGCDPQTAVFNVTAYQPFRQHVLMPSGPGRGSTFDLHGHVWQRDPYVCPGDSDLGLLGKCDMGNGHAGSAGTGSVGSQNLGDNPIGFSLGGIESWFASQHYDVVIPSAGGANGATGDYLFRDHMGLGNSQGLWGIIRVEAP